MSAGVRTPAGNDVAVIGSTAATSTTSAGHSARHTVTRYWDRLSSAAGDHAVVAISHGVGISESEFRSRVNSWRKSLELVAQEAVGLYEPNGVEFAAALLGAWYAGKNVYLPGDAQPETCRALAARNVLLIGTYPETVAHLRSTAGESNDEPFEPLSADNAHVVIFTSGSSGTPQAVPKRLTQLLAEVGTLEVQFGGSLAPADVVVATVSHQHIYGLLFKILWPLDQHRAFESESLLYPEQLAAQLQTGTAIVVSGPAHLKRLPDSLDWRAARNNARVVFSSGGPLPVEATSHCEKLLGRAPIEVYGSSETGGIAWRQRTGGIETPWTPLPGVDVRAEDGRLAVCSAHLATSEWLLVEDHAEFDSAGRFVLKGRADRVAKIEGKRVSLVAMEEVLLQTGLVTEVRLGQLESTRDEIGAVVVPNDAGWSVLRTGGSSELRRVLNEALRGSVEPIAHPRRWRWVDALPVNATGKTTNAAVVSLFNATGAQLPAMHVLESSGTDAHVELYISSLLPVFDGHFREIPVLPGVAQVDWVMVIARKLFGISAPFQKMEAVKFHKVYQPGPLLSLHMQWHPERHMLSFRYESPNATHSSGRIFFAH